MTNQYKIVFRVESTYPEKEILVSDQQIMLSVENNSDTDNKIDESTIAISEFVKSVIQTDIFLKSGGTSISVSLKE